MKKLLTTLLLISLFFLGVVIADNGSYLIVRHRLRRYSYQKDKYEYFQSPDETMERKKGDCEDFAILTNHWLQLLGYKPTMYVIMYEHMGHAITVFKVGSTYRVFSNMYLSGFKSKTLMKLLMDYSSSLVVDEEDSGKLVAIYVFKPYKYGKINGQQLRKSLKKRVY